MFFIHEIGHYHTGNKIANNKVMEITNPSHTEADDWNIFTYGQIQKIAKAGLYYERTAIIIFTTLNCLGFLALHISQEYFRNQLITSITVVIFSYIANWKCNTFLCKTTDGYWFRHPRERLEPKQKQGI